MMDYLSELASDDNNEFFPDGLRDHLKSKPQSESKTKFSYPEIKDLLRERSPRDFKPIGNTRIRLPARINSPLIPYSDLTKVFITSGCKAGGDLLHDHHFNQLKILQDMKIRIPFEKSVETAAISFDINLLRRMCQKKYGVKTGLINSAATSFATKSTNWDLSIAAMKPTSFLPEGAPETTYLSFLIMIQRLRVFLAQVEKDSGIDSLQELNSEIDAALSVFKSGGQLYHARGPGYTYYLMMCGGHFQLYHSDEHKWYAGSIAHLDYMFTTADILNNIAIISTCAEYDWAREFLQILVDLAKMDSNHNDVVNFMKGLEGFLLNLSDYDEEYAMNWRPLLSCLHELWVLDQKICQTVYPLSELIPLLHMKNISINRNSILSRIISSRWRLTGNQLQELSSLHKFIFYAEVDAMAGVHKFLGRVHTKRAVDGNSINNLTRLAKRLFFCKYTQKHKSIPKILGPSTKVQLLTAYGGKFKFEKIDALGLTWWDEITIFNCMDNILTEDPLEFAKDKGAIKDNVRLGPGDSRKELLQVIEKENYILKDFFADAPFKRKEQAIYRTNHSDILYNTKFPARLIEKEREQKIEARLFANGELENKHALSVIATRMKKVLNYFDEQLMTPPDKQRKELIHNAAQELLQPDVYSLMLDIEGHNQSMQYDNTSELAEFFGNLFGEFGWGSLPNYFGQLDVYHYDEYEDKVILSNGQHGGIEGWLNPFWTLHTTLMMKLLREMTSLEVRKIMVYSDDVNAIITLPNARESVVNKTFKEIIEHCKKFGMVVKMSQTALSKHRVTMLRQHFFDGRKSDSTLKKMISTSGANNPMVMSDELEVSGICSSISSAMEGTNHSNTCCYLKNFKLGLLMARLPHSILSRMDENSILSSEFMPSNIVNLLYQVKDDSILLDSDHFNDVYKAVVSDLCKYLKKSESMVGGQNLETALSSLLKLPVSRYRYVDSADRILYLQIYDTFINELLFFWIYLPTSLGGLGGSLHINLFLSGHSCGFSKSLHYLHQWAGLYSKEQKFFFNYIETLLSINMSNDANTDETRLLTSNWPCDNTVTSATTSISQSLKSMVRKKTKNKMILEMFKLDEEQDSLKKHLICIFRENFHPRIVQFYYENTSSHFLDLLINKIETSSSILSEVASLPRLRNSLVKRNIENIRLAAKIGRTSFGRITKETQTVEYCLLRRSRMFPNVKFIEVDEILYDNIITETIESPFIITIRQSSPYHYDRGIRVFDQPHVGNEILYKGELLEEDRMIGNKEEFLAARLVTITKWMIMKGNIDISVETNASKIDCIAACNLALSTLTGQTFFDLVKFSPTEVGGEILHRIPNMRFNSGSYIRSEYNRSLRYTSEIDQRLINNMNLVDSNINFDYLRLRLILASLVLDIQEEPSRFIVRYKLNSMVGIYDVQFITPKTTKCEMTGKFTSYGSLRKHEFSEMRFRFMSSHYLYMDNILDISTIPNLVDDSQISSIGDELVDDMIISYMKRLNNEHMSISNSYIDINSWKPLLNRIKLVKPEYRDLSEEDMYQFLAERLSTVLVRRHQPKIFAKKNSLITILQNQCLQSLGDIRPLDSEFLELTNRLLQLSSQPIQQKLLMPRMAKYQNALIEFDSHRRNMSLFIACEYLLLFCISVTESNYSLELDVNGMVSSLSAEGISLPVMVILCPQIAVQINLIGHQPFDNYIREGILNIKAILEEIRDDNILANIIIPENLPSTQSETNLSGAEAIPRETLNLEYTMDEISNENMELMSEMKPLLSFAKRCSLIAANPQMFTSITGSDSLSSQYALFKELKSRFGLETGTKICDLTAGRGDFQYVCRELGLSADSYSKRDVFTQVYHHPLIQFKDDYDVFDNSSLKFILSYGWVHVDISFTGESEQNICDLIFLLEESNIGYSIRLNSVSVENYELRTRHTLPEYLHYISYPVNRYNRPYQVYLVGVPGQPEMNDAGIKLRETLAFRSIAYGYAKLLTPFSRELRLHEYEPNSISIYLPLGARNSDLIKQVVNEELLTSQVYYMKRFLAEMSEDPMIYWESQSLNPKHDHITRNFHTLGNIFSISCYTEYSSEHIGQVSEESRRYRLDHLLKLHNDQHTKNGLRASLAPLDFLFYMRSAHPLQPIRAQCNILIGMNQFNYDIPLTDIRRMRFFLSENERLQTFSSTHFQRDFSNALKLMVISAFHGDYLYGLNYLWSLVRNEFKIRQSDINTIKIYRSISYLYEEIVNLLSAGGLIIQEINSLRQGFSRLDARRRSQKASGQTVLSEYLPFLRESDLLNQELDRLFHSLSEWATADELSDDIADHSEQEIGILSHTCMTLNLQIDGQIDSALRRLGIESVNRFGYFDIGDAGNWGEEECE